MLTELLELSEIKNTPDFELSKIKRKIPPACLLTTHEVVKKYLKFMIKYNDKQEIFKEKLESSTKINEYKTTT